MSQYGWQDCPADVKTQVSRLIENFKNLLAENLVGFYLHGSLAMNCFNPLRSDIDLLVVTRGGLSVETQRDLAKILLAQSNNPSPVEISFLRQSHLSPWRHPTKFDFHYGEDWRAKFERELADGTWKTWNDAQRFDDDLAAHITVMNHRGLCLAGSPVSEVFPVVLREDFLDSILGDVESAKFGYGAVLQYPVYVVLNTCRTLAYLQTGRIMSKEEGGVWALEKLPEPFSDTVDEALDEYRNAGNKSVLPKNLLIEFAEFMRKEIERAKTK